MDLTPLKQQTVSLPLDAGAPPLDRAPVPTDYRSHQPTYLVSAPLPFQFPSMAHLEERVDEILERMASVEGLQPSSIRWVRTAFKGFRSYLRTEKAEGRFLGGDPRLQVAVLDGWLAWMRRRGLARTSINNAWRALRLAFKRLQALDGVVNPLLLAPTPRVGRVLPRCLPRHTAERLLAAVRNYDWASPLEAAAMTAAVALMLLAGLRRGEVLRLENADVDVEAGTILIRCGKGRYGGKDRVAYAPPQLREILTAYRTRRAAAGCLVPAFLTTTGATPLGLGILRRLFRVASEAVGERVSPHMLRHSYATLLRQAGVPDRVAMDLLGHTSLQMLQRYSHVFDGEHQEQAKKLELRMSVDRH